MVYGADRTAAANRASVDPIKDRSQPRRQVL